MTAAAVATVAAVAAAVAAVVYSYIPGVVPRRFRVDLISVTSFSFRGALACFVL